MKRIIELILVIAYNLSLLAGASYLIVAHDFSAWIYLLALMFGAMCEAATLALVPILNWLLLISSRAFLQGMKMFSLYLAKAA